MKQITLNIPDDKYAFFLELVEHLGLEKVNDRPLINSGEHQEQQVGANRVASLRGKLQLSNKQYEDFHQYVADSRHEWNRRI